MTRTRTLTRSRRRLAEAPLTKSTVPDVLQAGKVFHELEGTEFYNMFRRNNARYETRVAEMVDAYLASIRTPPKKTRTKAAARKDYEDFNIRDYV